MIVSNPRLSKQLKNKSLWRKGETAPKCDLFLVWGLGGGVNKPEICFQWFIITDPGSLKLTDISYRLRFSFVSFACIVRSFFLFRYGLRIVRVIGSFVSFFSLIRRTHKTKNERTIHETNARFTRSHDTYK